MKILFSKSELAQMIPNPTLKGFDAVLLFSILLDTWSSISILFVWLMELQM